MIYLGKSKKRVNITFIGREKDKYNIHWKGKG
jgi:hypothetical protein